MGDSAGKRCSKYLCYVATYTYWKSGFCLLSFHEGSGPAGLVKVRRISNWRVGWGQGFLWLVRVISFAQKGGPSRGRGGGHGGGSSGRGDIAVVATEAAACRVLHPMVAGSAGLIVLQGKGIDRFVGDMDTDGKRVRSFLADGICWTSVCGCLHRLAPPCTACRPSPVLVFCKPTCLLHALQSCYSRPCHPNSPIHAR